jgi:1-pyrroline-5-carboxylate dehydrogenase
LIAGPYSSKINAATMLGQSKTVYQSEIDAVCELVDFLRYNVQYMTEIFMHQPKSTPDAWNRIEQRPLEGFVFALSPFNFTAIAGNLPTAPAMMGNVVVWKPANTQIYSAKGHHGGSKGGRASRRGYQPYLCGRAGGRGHYLFPQGFCRDTFHRIDGSLSGLYGKPSATTCIFTAPTPELSEKPAGKDFVLAHASAKPLQVATALSRGAFEYQGQKCSAASRAYISRSYGTSERII